MSKVEYDQFMEVYLSDINYLEFSHLLNSDLKDEIIKTTKEYLNLKDRNITIDEFKAKYDIDDFESFMAQPENNLRYIVSFGWVYNMRDAVVFTPKDNNDVFYYYDFFLNLKIRQTESDKIFPVLNYQRDKYFRNKPSVLIDKLAHFHATNPNDFYLHKNSQQELKRWIEENKEAIKIRQTQITNYYYKIQAESSEQTNIIKYLFDKLKPNEKSVKGFLGDDVKLSEFKKLFSKTIELKKEKVIWKESLGILKYFINNSKINRIFIPSSHKWKVTSYCYESSELGEFSSDQIARASSNISKEQKQKIDKMIQTLLIRFNFPNRNMV